jgi:ATP-dependent Clp protease, protease subunit
MTNDIYLIGEIGYDVTLQSVINQVDNSDKTLPLNVHIHSQGGGVYDGLAIYNYLKALPQGVNTSSSGLVASIASIIFLAGKKESRSINATDNFLIHLPSAMNWGNAKDLEKTAKELRDIEDKLSTIYENETTLTKDEALELMKKDEFLNVEFLKEKGFVNEIIEFKAVAKFGNTENNMSENLTKKEAENLFEKFGNKLKEIFNPENEALSNKIVQDATGTEIDFLDLKQEDAIIEGVKAKVEGKNADGDYLLPNGDKYTFENGVLKNIVEAEVLEVENLKNELTEVKNLVETKDAEILELTNKLKEKESDFEVIKNEFTELKNTVTSNFEHQDTVELPKKEEIKKESRTNFKSKIK